MGRAFQFAIVGGLATLVQFVVLIVGVELWHWRSDFASAVGYAVSGSLNYYLNYRWTFESDAAHFDASVRFFLMAVSGLMINTALMWVFSVREKLPYLPAQIVTTILIFGWSYSLSTFWVYRTRK